MTHVVPRLNRKWSDLGYQLLDEEHVHIIETISATHGDVTQCAEQLFIRWLKLGYDDRYTWDEIIRALKEIGLITLAHEIKKKLSPGS